MSYSSLADLAKDRDFLERIAACAIEEDGAVVGGYPLHWAEAHVWEVASAPGFAAAYESAQAGDVERPGRDPAVISDAQLLAVVQPMVTP